MEPNEYIKWYGIDIFSNFSWSLLRINQCGFKGSRNSCGVLLRIYSSILAVMKSSVLSKLSSMEPISTWYSWSSSKYLATPGQKHSMLLPAEWSRKPVIKTLLCPSENTQSLFSMPRGFSPIALLHCLSLSLLQVWGSLLTIRKYWELWVAL